MATENHSTSCLDDPNFATICSFLEKFGELCHLVPIPFAELQEMLENTNEVPVPLVQLHIRLLRRVFKSINTGKWEKSVSKFAHMYNSQDGWEVERFGYKKSKMQTKLRILKNLLESQFDYNVKFKGEVNKLLASDLRMVPLGRDQEGHSYWYQVDAEANCRVYREDVDEETWEIVASSRDEMELLITQLKNGEIRKAKSIEDNVIEEEINGLESMDIEPKEILLDTGKPSDLDDAIDADSDDNLEIAEGLPDIGDDSFDEEMPDEEEIALSLQNTESAALVCNGHDSTPPDKSTVDDAVIINSSTVITDSVVEPTVDSKSDDADQSACATVISTNTRVDENNANDQQSESKISVQSEVSEESSNLSQIELKQRKNLETAAPEAKNIQPSSSGSCNSLSNLQKLNAMVDLFSSVHLPAKPTEEMKVDVEGSTVGRISAAAGDKSPYFSTKGNVEPNIVQDLSGAPSILPRKIESTSIKIRTVSSAPAEQTLLATSKLSVPKDENVSKVCADTVSPYFQQNAVKGTDNAKLSLNQIVAELGRADKFLCPSQKLKSEHTMSASNATPTSSVSKHTESCLEKKELTKKVNPSQVVERKMPTAKSETSTVTLQSSDLGSEMVARADNVLLNRATSKTSNSEKISSGKEDTKRVEKITIAPDVRGVNEEFKDLQAKKRILENLAEAPAAMQIVTKISEDNQGDHQTERKQRLEIFSRGATFSEPTTKMTSTFSAQATKIKEVESSEAGNIMDWSTTPSNDPPPSAPGIPQLEHALIPAKGFEITPRTPSVVESTTLEILPKPPERRHVKEDSPGSEHIHGDTMTAEGITSRGQFEKVDVAPTSVDSRSKSEKLIPKTSEADAEELNKKSADYLVTKAFPAKSEEFQSVPKEFSPKLEEHPARPNEIPMNPPTMPKQFPAKSSELVSKYEERPVTSEALPVISEVHPVTSREPLLTSGEPPVTSGECPVTSEVHPVTAGKHPVTAGEHPVTSEVPPVTLKERAVTLVDPPVTLKKRVVTFAEPPVTSGKPPVTSEEPHVTSEEPHVTSGKPHVTSGKPPVTSEEPHVTSEEPPVTSEEPHVTLEEPPVTSVELPVTSEVPPVTSEVPPVTSEVPPVTSEVPPVTLVEPPVTSVELPVTSGKPPVTSEDPPVTLEEPLETLEVPSAASEERAEANPVKIEEFSEMLEECRAKLEEPQKMLGGMFVKEDTAKNSDSNSELIIDLSNSSLKPEESPIKSAESISEPELIAKLPESDPDIEDGPLKRCSTETEQFTMKPSKSNSKLEERTTEHSESNLKLEELGINPSESTIKPEVLKKSTESWLEQEELPVKDSEIPMEIDDIQQLTHRTTTAELQKFPTETTECLAVTEEIVTKIAGGSTVAKSVTEIVLDKNASTEQFTVLTGVPQETITNKITDSKITSAESSERLETSVPTEVGPSPMEIISEPENVQVFSSEPQVAQPIEIRQIEKEDLTKNIVSPVNLHSISTSAYSAPTEISLQNSAPAISTEIQKEQPTAATSPPLSVDNPLNIPANEIRGDNFVAGAIASDSAQVSKICVNREKAPGLSSVDRDNIEFTSQQGSSPKVSTTGEDDCGSTSKVQEYELSSRETLLPSSDTKQRDSESSFVDHVSSSKSIVAIVETLTKHVSGIPAAVESESAAADTTPVASTEMTCLDSKEIRSLSLPTELSNSPVRISGEESGYSSSIFASEPISDSIITSSLPLKQTNLDAIDSAVENVVTATMVESSGAESKVQNVVSGFGEIIEVSSCVNQEIIKEKIELSVANDLATVSEELPHSINLGEDRDGNGFSASALENLTNLRAADEPMEPLLISEIRKTESNRSDALPVTVSSSSGHCNESPMDSLPDEILPATIASQVQVDAPSEEELEQKAKLLEFVPVQHKVSSVVANEAETYPTTSLTDVRKKFVKLEPESKKEEHETVKLGTKTVKPEPESVKQEIETVKPDSAKAEPESVKQEIETVKPDSAKAEPESVEPKREDVKPEIESVKVEPELESGKPELESVKVEPELESVQSELESVKPELESVKPELESVKPELESVKPELESVKPELESVKPELESVKPELESVKPELELVKPELESTKVEPESSKLSIESTPKIEKSIKPTLGLVAYGSSSEDEDENMVVAKSSSFPSKESRVIEDVSSGQKRKLEEDHASEQEVKIPKMTIMDNPIVGEAIEEDLMVIIGSGEGAQNEGGNESPSDSPLPPDLEEEMEHEQNSQDGLLPPKPKGRGRPRKNPPKEVLKDKNVREKSTTEGKASRRSSFNTDDQNGITSSGPVRRSGRVAQIRQKEEEERRKLEEERLAQLKEAQVRKQQKQLEKELKATKQGIKPKDPKVPKKPKGTKSEKQESYIPSPSESGSDSDNEPEEEYIDRSEKPGRKKRKKRSKNGKPIKRGVNPWMHSSSEEDEAVEEEEDDHVEEEEEEELIFNGSDHEFSPESDIGEESEYSPSRHARTAKQKEEAVDKYAETYCDKCGKGDHPEWILLCDSCDKGWHALCVNPQIWVIPEGEWFCPPCQHNMLVSKLSENLVEYEKLLKKRENEVLRKQRLAYVGISLNNVLPSAEKPANEKSDGENVEDEKKHKKSSRRRRLYSDEEDIEDFINDNEDGDEDESGSGSGSYESEEEPIYQLRARKATKGFSYQEYDDMIKSALRGDSPDEEEKEKVDEKPLENSNNGIAPEVKEENPNNKDEGPNEEDEDEDDDDKIGVVKKQKKPTIKDEDTDEDELDEKEKNRRKMLNQSQKKNRRRLNDLDATSEEDSDEDFKGSGIDDDDDDEENVVEEDSDWSEDGDESDDSIAMAKLAARKRKRHGPLGRQERYSDVGTVRRSTRRRKSRITYDESDQDEDEEDQTEKWQSGESDNSDSESESDDETWGKKKKKKVQPAGKSRLPNFFLQGPGSFKKKPKKKRRRTDEDDVDRAWSNKFGNKGRKSDEPVERKTRGRQINFKDILDSGESDDDGNIRPKRRRILSDSDEDSEEPSSSRKLAEEIRAANAKQMAEEKIQHEEKLKAIANAEKQSKTAVSAATTNVPTPLILPAPVIAAVTVPASVSSSELLPPLNNVEIVKDRPIKITNSIVESILLRKSPDIPDSPPSPLPLTISSPNDPIMTVPPLSGLPPAPYIPSVISSMTSGAGSSTGSARVGKKKTASMLPTPASSSDVLPFPSKKSNTILSSAPLPPKPVASGITTTSSATSNISSVLPPNLATDLSRIAGPMYGNNPALRPFHPPWGRNPPPYSGPPPPGGLGKPPPLNSSSFMAQPGQLRPPPSSAYAQQPPPGLRIPNPNALQAFQQFSKRTGEVGAPSYRLPPTHQLPSLPSMARERDRIFLAGSSPYGSYGILPPQGQGQQHAALFAPPFEYRAPETFKEELLERAGGQAPPPPVSVSAAVPVLSVTGSGPKEEGNSGSQGDGEFGGLVSYFSSQHSNDED